MWDMNAQQTFTLESRFIPSNFLIPSFSFSSSGQETTPLSTLVEQARDDRHAGINRGLRRVRATTSKRRRWRRQRHLLTPYGSWGVRRREQVSTGPPRPPSGSTPAPCVSSISLVPHTQPAMADSEFEEFRHYFERLPQHLKAPLSNYTWVILARYEPVRETDDRTIIAM